MAELHDRFRSLDGIPAPDLWDEIEERAAAVAPEPLDRVRGAVLWPAGVRLSPRLAVAIVLLLVAIAVGLVVVGSRLLNQTPRLPPAGTTGLMTYSMDGDIYIADGDGANPVVVADGVISRDGYYGPLWSPDGRFILYYGQGEESFIIDAAGRLVVELNGYCSAWSPDSTHVACITGYGQAPAGDLGDRIDRHIVIFLTAIDGTVRDRIDLPQDWRVGNIFRAFWSPDGQSIVISRLFAPSTDTEEPFGGRTWLLPLDTGDPQPLPVEPPYASRELFSPDGSRVAGIANDGQLVVAEADGSNARPLLAGDSNGGEAVSVAWSPNGDRIALVYAGALSVVAVEDGTRRVLWSPPEESEDGLIFGGYVAGWSAEGDRILVEWSAPGSEGLWSVMADGSGRQRLAAGQPNGGSWQQIRPAPGTQD